MKVPNWVYLVLVIGGIGGLTLFLSFLFFYAFQVYSDFYIFLLILVPFFISLPTAYAILSRKYHSPTQRRLLTSIIVTFTGIIMLLSGFTVYFTSFFNDPLEALIGLIGFIVTLHGFSLALPNKATNGVLNDLPGQPEHPDLTLEETRGYLPAAGVATLLATILTSLVTFLTIPTAYGACYSAPATCIPISMIILGVLSAIGVVTGIAATSALLKGRYRRTVPLGLIFLTISPLLILAVWDYWLLLALPILALSISSIALTAWSQKDSMKTSDWRALGILSASLGAIALVAGTLQFSYNPCNPCLSACVRPYLNNAGLLLSLGASGITFALMSLDAARANRVRPAESLPFKSRKAERSLFFKILIILLTISLAITTIFAGALVGPFFTQCRGFCPTRIEQIYISQVAFGPSPNQVTFTLQNSGTSDVTISEAQVQGPGISNSTYTAQLSTQLVCAESSTVLLVATFQGVTFVRGANYNFVLISSHGNKFPYSVTL